MVTDCLIFPYGWEEDKNVHFHHFFPLRAGGLSARKAERKKRGEGRKERADKSERKKYNCFHVLYMK